MTKINSHKTILAFVGMPGAGKTEAAAYLQKKDIPFVRFGEATDEGLSSQGLPLNAENERTFREKLRKELGMAAYAMKAKAKIDLLLGTHDVIVIEGLYSWEEYIYLKNLFPGLRLILVYAEPEIRYKRLAKRPIRPLTHGEARERDLTEVEKLNKGGPIAIADHLIENNGEQLSELYKKIDQLFSRVNNR